MKFFNIIDKSHNHLFQIWVIDIVIFFLFNILISSYGIAFLTKAPALYLYLYWFAIWIIVMHGIWAFFAGLYKYRHSNIENISIKKHKSLINSWCYSMVIFTIAIFFAFISVDVSSRNDEYLKLLIPYSEAIGLISVILILCSFTIGCISYTSAFFLPKDNRGNNINTKFSNAKINEIPTIKETLEDVLFVPRKKSNSIKKILIAVSFIVAISSVLLSFLLSEDENISPEARIDTQPKIEENIKNSLEVIDISSTNNRTGIMVKGTVRNYNSVHAKNVLLRVDFYKAEKDTIPFDTRFLTLDYVAGNGAYTFEEPLSINYDKQYWFRINVESAEQL